MTHTPTPGSGALFKNDRKSKDIHPDYNGSLTLPDGSTMQLGGWISTRQDGQKYLALKVSAFLPPRQDEWTPNGSTVDGKSPRQEGEG